ncbi:MAG: LysM peptidoglycan-binding domain-containing protein [Kangiellaceae bacterium]|nr:LysM peptidoglycan-binding domain-containing protein [Kangiellaceae bacterium]
MKQLLVISCLALVSCKTMLKQEVTDVESKNSEFITQKPEPLPAPILERSENDEHDLVDINQIAIEAEPEPTQAVNLWEYLNSKQTIAQVSHKRIERFKKQFLKKPFYLVKRAKRAAPYLHYIINELEKRNMPIELAFTPMVESNFDPLAHSVVQAAGLWQFMPRTAKGFGLIIDEWYDGRRDVVASTKAALDYYQYLNKMFDGDWLLTVAAFNAGEGNVLKAMKANKRAKKPLDYWSLDLPRETQRHIPKWIALSNIFLNAPDYKVELPIVDNLAAFREVEVDAPANLMQLAKIANIDKDIFYRLNPAYNRLFVPEQHKKATILVPVSHIEHFQNGLINIDTDALMVSISYTVKSGDNLSTIAKNHNTNTKTLKSLNQLTSNTLKIGQVLKLPGSVHASETEKSFFATLDKNQQRRRYQTYKVQSGDSLWKVAKKFNVTTAELIRWNQINKKSVLKIGQPLKIWPKGNTSYASNKTTYTVQSGDSLYTIARKFKVKIEQITQWNRLNKKSYIKPGQVLTIYP